MSANECKCNRSNKALRVKAAPEYLQSMWSEKLRSYSDPPSDRRMGSAKTRAE